MTTLEPQQARGILRKIVAFLQVTLVAALLGYTLKTFVVEAIYIPSPSMESTLLVGDFLFVNKMVYGARTPALSFLKADLVHLPGFRRVERGDVVVFHLPTSSSTPTRPVEFVKRCLAIAGDTISVHHGLLSVNGAPIPSQVATGEELAAVRVPRRGDSLPIDSETLVRWKELIEREGHTVETEPDGTIRIDGLPASSYTVGKNYLFVLGDNRDHSYDSRQWGFLPEENVVGEAMVVYWSADQADGIRWKRIGTIVR